MGPEQTVLGGFSMGAVMSHTMAWSADRPPVAGVLAFSGFVPTVPGWRPSFEDRTATRAFIAHGTQDPVIEVGFGRAARDLLVAGGIDVTYRESGVVHTIDPADVPVAGEWLAATLPRSA
jgi:phospholipase/carboxylesterase